jgi:V8-like Glu-specific endopeptidase
MIKRIAFVFSILILGYWSYGQDKPKTEPYQFPYGDLVDTTRGVFGVDNRSEARDAVVFKDMVRATAVMIHKSKIKGNKVYSETLRTRLSRQFGVSTFHENVKFLDQPTCATCTGFLIAPDILVTAGHCIEKMEDAEDYVWIFDFTIDKNYNSFGGYFTIDPNEIYEVKEVMGAYFQSVSTYTDYSFLRLNKKSDRPPYQFRTSGKIASYTNVFTIGSPTGLPLKLADDAWVVSNSYEKWFRNSIDGFPGNSGGPVFNEYGLIEGIHVRGAVELNEGRYTGDYKFDSTCNCIKTVQWSSTIGTEGSHAHRITAVPQNLLHEALYENIDYAITTNNINRLNEWLAYSWFTNSKLTEERGRFEFKAASKNNLEMLKIIISKSLNAKVTDKNGQNLLFYALEQNSKEMMEYLLKKGVSPNKADEANRLVTHVAIAKGNSELTQVLIKRGASVSKKDGNGETALHGAARSGDLNLVKLIVSKGADLSAKNNQGRTAKVVAKKCKHKKIKKYLRKASKGKA